MLGLINKNFILFFPDESPPGLKTNAAKSLSGGTRRMSCDESIRKAIQMQLQLLRKETRLERKGRCEK